MNNLSIIKYLKVSAGYSFTSENIFFEVLMYSYSQRQFTVKALKKRGITYIIHETW